MPEEQDTPKQPINEELSADAIVQDSSISPSETQTLDMEVHHHPQLQHNPKPWKEYLLEYLMILLAVITGFFAESLREHIGDNAKEKEYLSSMVTELKFDTVEYNNVLKKIFYLRPLLDSLYLNVQDARQFKYVLLGKWNTPINETRLPYMPTLPTIQQMKSSGNLRLIQSKPVLNKILEYETFVQGTMQSETTNITTAMERIYAMEDDMCNEAEFNDRTDKNMQDVEGQYNMENGSYYDMLLVVKDPVRLMSWPTALSTTNLGIGDIIPTPTALSK